MAHQLTLEERERISQMRYARFTNAEIAEELGRHRATISRELRATRWPANTGPWRLTSSRVSGATAEGWYGRWIGPRWTSLCGAIWCITGHPTRLRGDRSVTFLARVAGRCRTRRSMPGSTRNRVADRQHFTGFLRFAGRRRPGDDRRGRIPRQVSIEGRPRVVDARRRYGDWEGDTVVGARQSGAVVTLVERKSGYLLSAKSCDRKARRVADKIQSRLGRLPARLRRTATFDNGKEFAEHERLSKRLGMNVYFAQPYCSWQRGTNEHTNGLLRQFLPKGTDLRTVSWQELEHYTTLINDRPRKRLNYRTPAELFEPLVAIES